MKLKIQVIANENELPRSSEEEVIEKLELDLDLVKKIEPSYFYFLIETRLITPAEDKVKSWWYNN